MHPSVRLQRRIRWDSKCKQLLRDNLANGAVDVAEASQLILASDPDKTRIMRPAAFDVVNKCPATTRE